MGQRAKIRPDAGRIALLAMDGGRPGSRMGFSHDEWRWRAIVGAIEGRDLPVIEGICGGVTDCVYVLLDGSETFASGGFGGQVRSRVVAVPSNLVESIAGSDDESPDVPIEPRDATGPGAWWKGPDHNLDVVRLATPWVDGFMAFTPHIG